MIHPAIGHHLRRASEKGAMIARAQRENRQLAEGIPAEWDRYTARSYRGFRDRRAAAGLPFVSAADWASGDYRIPRDTRRKRPEGWSVEEWHAYTSAQSNRRRNTELPQQTPEEWREAKKQAKKHPPNQTPWKVRKDRVIAKILEKASRRHQ